MNNNANNANNGNNATNDNNGKTKRKRCSAGTQWLEHAQKCMTPDEKAAFMADRKNKTKKIKPTISKKPVVVNQKEPVVNQKEPVVNQKEPLVTKEPNQSSVFSNFVNIFSKPNNDLKSEEKEEEEKKEEKKEEKEDLPQNILLQENQKRCPPHYTRYPPKSRNCRLTKSLKEIEDRRKTRKKTYIPEIKSIHDKNNDNEYETVNKIASDTPFVMEEKQIELEEREEDDIKKADEIGEREEKKDSTEVKEEEEEKEGESKETKDSTEVKEEEEEIGESKEIKDSTEVKEEEEIESKEIKDAVGTEQYEELDPEDAFLYPELSDPNFNEKIYNKKEFNDYQYDGTIHDIREQSTKECNAPFEIMPHQQFVKNFLSMETPYNSLLLYHELGTGKCHGKGTPILMFDGTIKLVENIKVGDLLMGDDSTPRIVLSLANGRDKMYDIIPTNGDKYTVNEEHILCLRSQNIEKEEEENITEITVKDYLGLNENRKSELKGYKVSVDFSKKLPLPIHPYTLGLSFDKYSSSEKSIPINYKCNTRENRFILLAGIIDINGQYITKENHFKLIYKDEQLANDIIFVARSLGFCCNCSCSCSNSSKEDSNNDDSDKEYSIFIKGNLSQIPTTKEYYYDLIIPSNDYLMNDIQVKYIGEDDYYGFTLNANGRYLLGDFTVTHNTCSAIGITEETRKYMKQFGNVKKILIVASPKVQENFKLQLYDEYKLKEIGRVGSGIWDLNSCIGNDLLKEINPHNDIMTKQTITKKIQGLIRESYEFIGYESLANYIKNVASISGLQMQMNEDDEEYNNNNNNNAKIDERKIRKEFDNRMIVIDEVHNIIGKDDSDSKLSSRMLLKLVKYCKQLRLLFLSATPMYNSLKEIIWLVNIMNINDQRSTINTNDVFNEDGYFVEEIKDENGIILKESGKDILRRKIIGYISYVRGENPYIFPYRIYPSDFAPVENQILALPYPKKQMNGKIIDNPLKYVQVYANKLGEYQQKGYSTIVENTLKNIPDFEEKETFGTVILIKTISALNMIYPNSKLDEFLLEKEGKTEEGKEEKEGEEEKSEEGKEEKEEGEERTTNIDYIISEIQGKRGFENVMSFKTQDHPVPLCYDFEYKPAILKKYGRIFSKEHIGKYSGKIANICNILENSKGIVLIYSKYIEGGLIPMALALEEMGFSRYTKEESTKSLFKEKPVPNINPLTMKPDEPGNNTGYIARYVMITGQKHFSPDNNADIKMVTDNSNIHGEHVRVVLISESGSEGLDFKNIRQVHILDPWYNMNRVEQVIGRAVRTKSHCKLPLKNRNVEIYLHGSYLNEEEEMVDMYMYRLAEKKALLIGQVTRLLKENAVDCLLNQDQMNFTVENIAQTLPLQLSTNDKEISFAVGDKPYTNMCDYMETCTYNINGKEAVVEGEEGEGEGEEKEREKEGEKQISETYTQYFLQNNYSRIAKRIRDLFREKSVYTFEKLVKEINIQHTFPLEQIYYTISIFITNKEWLFDKKGRKGYLIKKKDIYLFQSLEIKDENASIFERTSYVDYKRKSIPIEIPNDPILSVTTSVKVNNVSSKKTPDKNIWTTFEKTMDIVFSQSSYIKPMVQNMYWFHYAKLAYRICIHKHNIPVEICKKYVVFHYLDLLSIEEKLWFLQNIDTNINEYSEYISQYFQEKINENRILLNDKTENKVFKKEKNNIWKPTKISSGDEEWLQSFEFKDQLLDHMNHFVKEEDRRKKEFHIGFMSAFKENMEFKIKNLLNSRQNVGAACYQTNKKKLIDKINDLIDILKRPNSEKYSDDPVFTTNIIERQNLCLVYEFLLRYFTEETKRIWFLNVEQSVATKIDTFVAIPQTIMGNTKYVFKDK